MLDLRTCNNYRYQSSSKGNQPKYYNNGYWFKVDSYRNHEGLAEEFVSQFLCCIGGINFVTYKAVEVTLEDDYITKGCISQNMYQNTDISFTSLRSLLDLHNHKRNITFESEDIMENIKNTIYFIYTTTGIDTSLYFSQLAYLDSIILNEDRHIMNVGVCYNNRTGRFMPAPIFDNGASLFCTNWTYSQKKSLEDNIVSALRTGRPFSKFHMKQVEAFNKLGCPPLVISKSGVERLLTTYQNQLYDKELVDRVKSTLVTRLRQTEGVSFTWAR